MKKLSLYILFVFIWCNLSVNANAVPKTKSGKGELFLSEKIIEGYYDYVTKPLSRLPLIFFISEDKKDFYTIIINQDGKGAASSRYINRNIGKCQTKLKQKCYVFSNSRHIVWDNGINPRKGKKSKINYKTSKEDLIIKLSELGFIETKEQKAAKEKKITEEKLAKENKVVEDKAAKDKRIAKEKAAKEKKIAEQKAAKEKKIAEQKAAEEKKIAEQKAAEEKLNKKLSLVPAETDLEKAQNFLKNLQAFIKLYPDEFDIIKVSELFILTRPVIDGDLNYKSKKDLEQFKEFTNTSDRFVKYNNDIEKDKRNNKLNKIDDAISSLENNINIIKGFLVTDPNSIYLEEWLNGVKNAELIIDNPSSYDQLLTANDDLIKLTKSKNEIDEVIADLNNNIDELKEILKQNLTTDLAPLLLEQAKLLEIAIKKETIDAINLASSEYKDFIYKNIIEPEEKRIAEEKRIVEEKRVEEIRIAEAKAAKERKIAEEKVLAEIKNKYKNLPQEQRNFIKLLEDTKLKDISTVQLISLNLTKRNGTLITNLNNKIFTEKYEGDGSKCKKPLDKYSFCTEIKTLEINDWIGIVNKIHANADGSFYPSIAMPMLNDITKKSKNTLDAGSVLMTSDSGYNYLIKPSNPLYETVAYLNANDKVLISGNFFVDKDTGYLATEEWTKKNQIKKPSFTFRFTKIKKID